MKQLQKEFIGRGEVKGFRFTQLKQNQYAFIYKVETSGGKHYEVFRKKINNKYNCESYPRSKSFGSWAWSFFSYEKALLKFDEVSI